MAPKAIFFGKVDRRSYKPYVERIMVLYLNDIVYKIFIQSEAAKKYNKP